jgi:hypothetical protein
MTDPTNTDKARYVAERLGLCWHEPTDDVTASGDWNICTCGFAYIKPENHRNPDYCADPRLVLGVMMKREDWPRFAQYICSIPYDFVFTPQTIELASCKWAIPTRHITETGLLLDAAYRFLREKEGV